MGDEFVTSEVAQVKQILHYYTQFNNFICKSNQECQISILM